MVFCRRKRNFDWLNRENALEDVPCLVSKDYPITSHEHKPDHHRNKQPFDTSIGQETITNKTPKQETNNQNVALTADRSTAGNNSDTSSLIPGIGRDNSVNCLIRCPIADYNSIASLNRSFRSLVESGELYKLRRRNGSVEHLVYFSCHLLEWEAFDPKTRLWMHLPRMDPNECFLFADKESLAVGSELLIFGRGYDSHVIYRYSIVTKAWTTGMVMNEPRCLFGSASFGQIAILAGGCDSSGNILDSAELYDSVTGNWKMIKRMNKARKMCSGIFMDGKFYVIGGIGGPDSRLLTCGEEYDLERDTWSEIPNMSPVVVGTQENELPASSGAPPLIAVVNNELYAADYANMRVRKYDKTSRVWVSIGNLPERPDSMFGWGLAFKACGERLIVIGGPRNSGEGFIEVNSWIPSGGGAPQWDVLARKRSASFVYNCAVMEC